MICYIWYISYRFRFVNMGQVIKTKTNCKYDKLTLTSYNHKEDNMI